MNNDPKLELAMAKLLPEHILIIEPEPDSRDYGNSEQFKWRNTNNVTDPEQWEDWFEVTEYEWLYVMQLVEQTLNEKELSLYIVSINPSWDFNSRATAMCKVKGIQL